MRDLVQLALPPRNPTSRGERAGSRLGDSAFSDALEVKAGKAAAAERAEDGAAHATAAAPGFRIGSGSHGATRLPISVAVESKLFQHAGADKAADGTIAGDRPEEATLPAELQAADEEVISLAEIVMLPGDGDVPPADTVSDAAVLPGRASMSNTGETQSADEETPGAARPAMSGSGGDLPATGTIVHPEPAVRIGNARSLDGEAPKAAETAMSGRDRGLPAAGTMVRAEAIIRLGRTASLGGEVPDAGEAPAAPHATATATAKSAGFSPLAPTISSAQKAAPASADAAVATAADGAVAKAAEAAGGIDDSTVATRKALPVAEKGLSETQRAPAGVKVIDTHSLPAPGQILSPASSVSQAITEAPDWMSFGRVSGADAAAAAPHAAASIKALTIQLHPAELGVVTAKLRFVGDQLTIELQVERGNAFEKLSADSETILKSVRALGIEVDRVTVQQQPAPSTLNARSETGASFSGGRETSFSAQGGSGGRESGGTGGNSAGGDAREDASAYAPGAGNSNQPADRRGVYI